MWYLLLRADEYMHTLCTYVQLVVTQDGATNMISLSHDLRGSKITSRCESQGGEHIFCYKHSSRVQGQSGSLSDAVSQA